MMHCAVKYNVKHKALVAEGFLLALHSQGT